MHDRSDALPVRWTSHALNTGLIFSVTVAGVRRLPRALSYAIGWAGAWLAWKFMRATNDAIASNLEPVFPHESAVRRRRRALDVYRSYTRDAIDFIRALEQAPGETSALFDLRQEDAALFADLLSRGNGLILVTAHWGNWEAGGILMGRELRLPTTVVALTEASPAANRIRQGIRSRMGIETIEVGRTHAFKASTGLELRFFMPVLNVPFRLIYAWNPSRGGVLDNNLQPAKETVFRFAVGTTF